MARSWLSSFIQSSNGVRRSTIAADCLLTKGQKRSGGAYHRSISLTKVAAISTKIAAIDTLPTTSTAQPSQSCRCFGVIVPDPPLAPVRMTLRPAQGNPHCLPPLIVAFSDTLRIPADAAWKEDHRRLDNGRLAYRKLGLALAHPVTRAWKGYWQRTT